MNGPPCSRHLVQNLGIYFDPSLGSSKWPPSSILLSKSLSLSSPLHPSWSWLTTLPQALPVASLLVSPPPLCPCHHVPFSARVVFLQLLSQSPSLPVTSQSCRQSSNPNVSACHPKPLAPAFLPQPDLFLPLHLYAEVLYILAIYTAFLSPCGLHCLTSKSSSTLLLLPGRPPGDQPSNI